MFYIGCFPLWHPDLVTFHLGIQEVLNKCIRGEAAAVVIRGFNWCPEHRAGGMFTDFTFACVFTFQHSFSFYHIKKEIQSFPPRHFFPTVVWSVGPNSWGQIPVCVTLASSLAFLCLGSLTNKKGLLTVPATLWVRRAPVCELTSLPGKQEARGADRSPVVTQLDLRAGRGAVRRRWCLTNSYFLKQDKKKKNI